MILDHYKGMHKQTEAPDLSLPEAIRVDKQRLAPFSPAAPGPFSLFSEATPEGQAPFTKAMPWAQDNSSLFLEQVAKCSEGLGGPPATRPGLEKAVETERLKLAEALQQLGSLHHREGNLEEALHLYEERLFLLRRAPSSRTNAPMAQALKHLGSLHYEMKDFQAAIRYFEEFLDITENHYPFPSEPERLESAAIATLGAAIRLGMAVQGEAEPNGRSASRLITLADKYLEGLNEEDYLVKKRSEELKYMKRILEEML